MSAKGLAPLRPGECAHQLILMDGLSGKHAHGHYECAGCREKFWDNHQVEQKIQEISHQRIVRQIKKGKLQAGPNA